MDPLIKIKIMNENLDLVEILKDCPKGTKFYSRFLGSVEFCKITLDNYIEVIGKAGYYIGFNPNGTYQHSEESAEIDLFPSKDQRDWSKWQRPFVDGDIVTCVGDKEKQIFIIKNSISNNNAYCYVGCSTCNNKLFNEGFWLYNRLATEEEKQILFSKLKKRGYKWNDTTKTLEKFIEPIFKVGDRIRKKGDYICGIIKCIDIDNFYKVEYSGGGVSFVNVKYQNKYELVPNKFDPKTLQPFDKVLVSSNDEWFCDFFSHYDNDVIDYNCICTGGCPYECCIPYNDDTKHLIGKSIEEAPEFYRYWEE